MSRLSWTAAACSIALLSVGACAGTNADTDTSGNLTATSNAEAQTQTAEPQTTTDASLAGADYSDAQLQSFLAAAQEINPIAQTLPTATPEQRTQAAEQIRAILTRNNLDADTYNAIASQAQTDAALSARLAALQTPQQPAPSEG